MNITDTIIELKPFVGIIAGIIAGIITGFFTSIISSYFVRKQFVSQRWWERKADAYTRIIEASFGMTNYLEMHYNIKSGIKRDIKDEDKELLRKKWKIDSEEVKKAATIGKFLVSKDASALLRDYLEKPHKDYGPDGLFEELESDYIRTESLLNDMIEMARADLEMPDGKKYRGRKKY